MLHISVVHGTEDFTQWCWCICACPWQATSSRILLCWCVFGGSVHVWSRMCLLLPNKLGQIYPYYIGVLPSWGILLSGTWCARFIQCFDQDSPHLLSIQSNVFDPGQGMHSISARGCGMGWGVPSKVAQAMTNYIWHRQCLSWHLYSASCHNPL